MANTQYKELADRFFNKIKEYDLLQASEDTVYDIAIGYIDTACNKYQSAKVDLSDRDDIIQEFNFELDTNTKDTLANYMVLEWLDSNYILTSQALKPRLSSTDFHSLNLDTMLNRAMDLHKLIKNETDQLAINKSYENSKIFDIVTNRKRG